MGSLAVVLVVVFLSMLGLTVFQTRMAKEQVQIDQIEKQVQQAQERREYLLRRRAELRAPQRLGHDGASLGLIQADAVGFVTVSPEVYAQVLTMAGELVHEDTAGASDGTPS
jgi:hypothetical protein